MSASSPTLAPGTARRPLVALPAALLAPARLRECLECGQIQTIPAMPTAARAICVRCGGVLRHTHYDPLGVPLALNLAALTALVIGAAATLMAVSTAGRSHAADLFSGPSGLERDGFWELAAVVLFTTFAAPLAKLLATTIVLLSLCHPNPPAGVRTLFAWVRYLRPWSMVEVYMLGVFVAYVRLGEVVRIELGPAVYALAALMVLMTAAEFTLDAQAVWEAMDLAGVPRPLRRLPRDRGVGLRRLGCDTCGLVSRTIPGTACRRCGTPVYHRKPNSISRTWALGIATMILYLPANLYPVLSATRLGANRTSTILGGVQELLALGMWPLAAVVFFASIAVPVLKLAGLGVLLVTTQTGQTGWLRDRAILYRIVDSIGRWSMIDIFMASLLVALLQFGSVVSVVPGAGAVCFTAVVILTMLAAQTFDPRLMWDAADVQADRAP
ncbi:MAG: paraquat-inducible protein A [Acetobacteraceae bacterium]|nr:paraquat-inducible protein A [Acetobacteraceae bacterium]